jgi:hypothetical protein
MTLYVRFSIWMASTTRWSYLTKVVALNTMPRAGEYVTFRAPTVDNAFAWRITEVIHREGDLVEIAA